MMKKVRTIRKFIHTINRRVLSTYRDRRHCDAVGHWSGMCAVAKQCILGYDHLVHVGFCYI